MELDQALTQILELGALGSGMCWYWVARKHQWGGFDVWRQDSWILCAVSNQGSSGAPSTKSIPMIIFIINISTQGLCWVGDVIFCVAYTVHPLM